MTPDPLVSVIMPAYNAQQTIAASIESVREQSYGKWELIVIDDGSGDMTAERVKRFAEDGRIHLYSQHNRGVAAARNRGLRKAQGELIAFLDADDLWDVEKLAKQVRLFRDDPAHAVGLVYTDKKVFEEDLRDAGSFLPGLRKAPLSVCQNLLIHNHITLSSVMMRREVVERLGGFDEQLFGVEDWDLWIRVCQKYDMLFLDEPLTYYREHAAGISKNARRMMEERWKVLDKHILSAENPPAATVRNEALWLFYRQKATHLFREGRYLKGAGYLARSVKHSPLKRENFAPMLKLLASLKRV